MKVVKAKPTSPGRRFVTKIVNEELHKIITQAYREVTNKVLADGITYRQAAIELGVQRVAHAIQLRGFV